MSGKQRLQNKEIEYFTGLMLKSKEYQELKVKVNILTHRNIGRSSSHDTLVQDFTLKSLQNKVKIYEKELEITTQRTSRPVNSEILLENEVKTLQLKLSEVEKENTRLNLNNNKNYLPKIINIPLKAIEEAYREIKDLKKSIISLEDQLIHNRNESLLRHGQFEELIQKHDTLKQQAGDYIQILPDKQYFNLQKKLEVLTTSWKNNVVKYELEISELEEELEELKSSYMQLNAKNFKKSQQQRLLRMSYDEVIGRKENSKSSLRPDIHHPGVSFMYKPSVKSLYNI